MRRLSRYSIKQLIMMPYSVPGEFKPVREFGKRWRVSRALRARRQHRQMARFECRAELEALELSSTADALFLEEMLEAQERDYAERAREYEVAYAESLDPSSYRARRAQGGRVAGSLSQEDCDDLYGTPDDIDDWADVGAEDWGRDERDDDMADDYDPYMDEAWRLPYDDYSPDDWYYTVDRRRHEREMTDLAIGCWSCQECRGCASIACSRPECDNYEPGTLYPDCDFDLSDDNIDDEEDYFAAFAIDDDCPAPIMPSLVEWHNRKRVA